MRSLRVLIFTPNIGANQTRKIRAGFLASGCVGELTTVGFARSVENIPDFPCEIIGRTVAKHYLSRLCAWWRALCALRRHGRQNDVIFTWTLDCMLLCTFAVKWLFKLPVKLVYNVRDVHPLCTQKNLRGWLLRRMDRWCARHADLLVTTSPAYVSEYYERILGA